MKTALLALVLSVIAPQQITFGPVSLTVGVLVLAVELAAAARIWLAVRILRPWFRRYFQSAPTAGGGAW